MTNVTKLLSRFDHKEREVIALLLNKIISLNWRALDVKKLKGYPDIYRVRKGDIRIIYRLEKKTVFILTIERRKEDTYKI